MANFAETPLMLQYLEMKKKHPDAILLFRVGDFYETFSDDAIAASEILGITLTRRANGKASSVELAGFPHHALDSYLPKLVRAGRRVAICEQLEDPKLTKKLVKRGITELVTPGVNTSPGALDSKENNFLAAIHIGAKKCGVAFLDISTGEFFCAEGSPSEINTIIQNMKPKEILRMRGTRISFEEKFKYKGSIFELDDWVYTSNAATDRLLKHFKTSSLKGFGIANLDAAIIAAGSILHYLDLTAHNNISHITSISRIDNRRFMHLDAFTMRNLEIMEAATSDGVSLRDILDKTVNPMGARLLTDRLRYPLLDEREIKERQDAVEAFYNDDSLAEACREEIRNCGDISRLLARVGTLRIGQTETVRLGIGLSAALKLKKLLAGSGNKQLERLAANIDDVKDVVKDIAHILTFTDSPTGKSVAIASGLNQELDELRALRADSKSALMNIQEREIRNTGIPSLKIGFNNVFGYYLEVRNTYKDKVPEEWIRKQTLVSAERYVTPELKDYEAKITGADERIEIIENDIFKELTERIASRLPSLQSVASGVAETDFLLSLATVARDYNYVRPEIDSSTVLDIKEGRHPVIERTLPPGEPYISNSLILDSNRIEEESQGCRIMMITGPNMSGKSALLRQTALIVLMAQIGSFVPADSARIGIIDKIFTRVGASDNISSGESTFMVEMNEAASILNNMTDRSLVIFDELGRGTSTYDGISIAWSIVEHIHNNGHGSPKTLFATHYHELNEMENKFNGIANFNISVKELGGKVVFMRKLEAGGSEHSFGLHVAKLAGLPVSIIRRASQVLKQLEEGSASPVKDIPGKGSAKNIKEIPDAIQMSFFNLDDPLLSQIRDRLLDVDINNLTPVRALNMLHDLQSLLRGKE